MVVYGVPISPKQLDDFLRVIYRRFPEKAQKIIKDYLAGEAPLFEEKEDLFIDAIKDKLWSFDRHGLLPKQIRIEPGEEGSDQYWVDFQFNMDGEIVGDHVVLKDFLAKEVGEALELLKEAGVKNTTLTLDSWEEYS